MVLEFQNNVPLSKQFDDLYFSRHGGWAEKDFVFVQANNLLGRFATATQFTIAELGFGTGLSFLATLAAWQKNASADATLDFYSIEFYPLNKADMAAAFAAQQVPEDLVAMLLQQWPNEAPTNDFTLSLGRVTLHLLVGDVTVKLLQLPSPIHAWFLDGFSPAKNPAMWGEAVWQSLQTKSATDATASTYSCALVVREGLASAGFEWQKVKGFGYKDGMISAIKKEA